MDGLKLLPGLNARGFHSSVATTFSVDGAFYDGVVQHRLHREGCVNNVLLADGAMLGQALAAAPAAMARAGRRYAVVPARVPGCFHPKILLRLGDLGARLQVCSANATAAGWCRNAELGCDVSHDARKSAADDPDERARGWLVRKAWDYVRHWLAAVPGEAVEAKLRAVELDAPWLADLRATDGPVAFADGTLADLLLERGDGTAPGILERFAALAGAGAPVRRVAACSPYWDADAAALRDLQDSLGGAPAVVALGGRDAGLPAGADLAERDVSFAALPPRLDSRFVHAKLVVAEADDGDHVLFGSANVTRAALGGRGGVVARNAEACVYRRLPPGTALPLLGIDPRRGLDRALVRAARPEPSAPSDGRPAAGVAEIEGRIITWWPPARIDPTGATLLHPGGEAPVAASGNATGRTELPATVLALAGAGGPLVVRFRLPDGRETQPVIVHHPEELRRASPRSYGRWTRTVLRFEQGLDDLLDLAVLADAIFGSDDGPGQGQARGRGKRTADDADRPAVQYKDQAEFVAATTDHAAARRLAAQRESGPGGPSDGARRGSWLDDPIVALCARLSMGCLTGEPDPRQERRWEKDEDEDTGAGEDEDRASTASDRRAHAAEAEAAGANTEPADARTRRRRAALKRALRRFDADIARRAADPALPVDALPPKVAFVLQLMFAAAAARGPDGEPLLSMLPERKRRDDCVAVRTLRALAAVWAGGPHSPPIVQRLDPSPPRLRERLNVLSFARLCRWAAARCLVALEDGGPAHAALAHHATPVVARVAAATAVLLPPDEEDEAAFAALEQVPGGDPGAATRLRERLAALRPAIMAMSDQYATLPSSP